MTLENDAQKYDRVRAPGWRLWRRIARPVSWHWEAKSVNNRGLDIRVRVAPGYDALEAAARDEIAKRFLRGSVSVTLNLDQQQRAATEVRLNETVLANVIAAAERVRALTGAEPARVEACSASKACSKLSKSRSSEAEMAACQAEMLATLKTGARCAGRCPRRRG